MGMPYVLHNSTGLHAQTHHEPYLTPLHLLRMFHCAFESPECQKNSSEYQQNFHCSKGRTMSPSDTKTTRMATTQIETQFQIWSSPCTASAGTKKTSPHHFHMSTQASSHFQLCAPRRLFGWTSIQTCILHKTSDCSRGFCFSTENDFRWVFITRFFMQQGVSTVLGYVVREQS